MTALTHELIADVIPRQELRSLSAHDLVRVPGLISLTRLPLAALFPLVVARPRRAMALLGLAGATDLLDGWYARHFHQETSTGAIVDGATDKVFALSVVASLVLSGSISVGETLLLATRDIGEVVLGFRLTADRRKRHHLTVPAANVGGKIATTLQYAAVAAVLLRSRLRTGLICATAVAGLVASTAYWKREVDAAHK